MKKTKDVMVTHDRASLTEVASLNEGASITGGASLAGGSLLTRRFKKHIKSTYMSHGQGRK